MRTIAATLSALALAVVGVLLAMPAMSNGGVLAGFEFFGMAAICLLCAALFAVVVQAHKKRTIAAWAAAVVVGIVAPFAVLAAPLVYCVAFQQGKSCV